RSRSLPSTSRSSGAPPDVLLVSTPSHQAVGAPISWNARGARVWRTGHPEPEPLSLAFWRVPAHFGRSAARTTPGWSGGIPGAPRGPCQPLVMGRRQVIGVERPHPSQPTKVRDQTGPERLKRRVSDPKLSTGLLHEWRERRVVHVADSRKQVMFDLKVQAA